VSEQRTYDDDMRVMREPKDDPRKAAIRGRVVIYEF